MTPVCSFEILFNVQNASRNVPPSSLERAALFFGLQRDAREISPVGRPDDILAHLVELLPDGLLCLVRKDLVLPDKYLVLRLELLYEILDLVIRALIEKVVDVHLVHGCGQRCLVEHQKEDQIGIPVDPLRELIRAVQVRIHVEVVRFPVEIAD